MDGRIADMPLIAPASEPARASARQRRFAVITGALLVVWGLMLTPFANYPWVAVPGYLTAFGTAMLVTNSPSFLSFFDARSANHSCPCNLNSCHSTGGNG